jgi:hypothetical protein
MSTYIPIDEFDQFIGLKSFGREQVTDELISMVKTFQEKDDLEKIILSLIIEPNLTPHGPTEIVDILSTQLSHKGKYGLTGIILKGSSFRTIKASTISHQVFRLRKLAGVKFAIFGYVGNILDNAKDEFIQTVVDLNLIYSFIDVIDFARLAILAGYLCPIDARRIKDGKCSCGYRVKGSELNFLQIDSLNRLQEARALKQSSGVVVLPTGTGKTRVAAIDSKNCNAQKILYVAHTHEILQNAHKEFSHVYGSKNVSYSFANIRNVSTVKVHLETIQTIARNMTKIKTNNYDYVIIDEFHHAAARSYRKLIDNISPNFMLGLTATPFRGDRQDVIELCNSNIIVEYELRTGIDGGILSPFHYYGLFDDVDYTNIRQFSYGYSIRDLDKALILESRDKSIISKWKDHAENLPTLAFCCSVNHAKRIALSFNQENIYVGLLPYEEPTYSDLRRMRSSKDILNVPLGCQVEFEGRVINIFAKQVFDPSHANRHNIAQILLHEYHKLSMKLGRLATKKEVDRYQILHSGLYELVFGNWRNFENLVVDDELFI